MIIFTDNSAHNGIKNWQKEIDQGVTGTILRATWYDRVVDWRFEEYKASCPHKNKGAYDYFAYWLNNGADQCKKFLDTVGDFGNIRGVLDLEDNSANGYPKLASMYGTALSRVMAWVDQYILETGHNPLLYLNSGLATQKQLTVSGYQYIFRNFVNKAGLWCANYNQNVYVNGAWVKMEKPPTGAWSECLMWQYTSKGDGIAHGNGAGSDYIDLNRVFNLQALLKPGITAEDEIIDMANVMNIEPLSQVDASRKDITFGNTKIGYDGCLTVDIEMMLNYLGLKIDTATLVTWLNANEGYYGNLFVWKSIEKLLPGLLFTAKYTGSNLDKIDESLARKMPVLVHVDYNPATSLIDQHWVLVVGKSGSSYIINDPRDGSRVRFEDVYGDPATHIYNVATYSFTGTISDAEKLSRLWLAHPTLH